MRKRSGFWAKVFRHTKENKKNLGWTDAMCDADGLSDDSSGSGWSVPLSEYGEAYA
jgi:hypothetical protein